MTLKEMIEQSELQLKVIRIPFRKDIDWGGSDNPSHFAYTLYFPYGERSGKKMEGFYSMGSAHKGLPNIEDIVSSLMIDVDGIEGRDFLQWCGDLGENSDSRKVKRIYESCVEEYNELIELMGYPLLQKFIQCDR